MALCKRQAWAALMAQCVAASCYVYITECRRPLDGPATEDQDQERPVQEKRKTMTDNNSRQTKLARYFTPYGNLWGEPDGDG